MNSSITFISPYLTNMIFCSSSLEASSQMSEKVNVTRKNRREEGAGQEIFCNFHLPSQLNFLAVDHGPAISLTHFLTALSPCLSIPSDNRGILKSRITGLGRASIKCSQLTFLHPSVHSTKIPPGEKQEMEMFCFKNATDM